MTSYEIMKFDDAKIELIESSLFTNKTELIQKEGLYQNQFKNITVNIQIAGRSRTDYYNDNKEIICQKVKQYNENNIDKVQAYQKQWYDKNKSEVIETIKIKREIKETCDCGGTYSKCRRSEHIKRNKHLSYLNSKTNITNETTN